MVGNVEDFGAELYPALFAEQEIPVYRKINGVRARTFNYVAACVAKCVERRRRKHGWIKPQAGFPLGARQIGIAEQVRTLTGPSNVSHVGRNRYRDRLTCLYGNDSADLPTFCNHVRLERQVPRV